MSRIMEHPTVKSLIRGLDILSCFSIETPSWGITKLARQLGLPKSSVHRLVSTLESKRFLRREARSKDYELGFKVLAIAGSLPGETEELRLKAASYLRTLHKLTSCTVSLRVMDGEKIVILDRLEAPHNLRVVFPVGTHFPINHGASGKIFLAYEMPEKRLAALLSSRRLKKLTDKTIAEPSALKRALKTIRKQGYAVSKGEAIPGACGIAAPVFRHDGRVCAALSLTFPESLSPKHGLDEYIQLLKGQARKLSADCGFVPGRLKKIA
jgi:DNA-binding IclR family transcriptional regulator